MSSIGLFCRSLLQVFFGCIRSLLSEWVLVVEVAGVSGGSGGPTSYVYLYIYGTYIYIYILEGYIYIYMGGYTDMHIYCLP